MTSKLKQLHIGLHRGGSILSIFKSIFVQFSLNFSFQVEENLKAWCASTRMNANPTHAGMEVRAKMVSTLISVNAEMDFGDSIVKFP